MIKIKKVLLWAAIMFFITIAIIPVYVIRLQTILFIDPISYILNKLNKASLKLK